MQFEDEYRLRINRAVDYIENHLDHKFTLGQLARASGLSPYHFHRLFLLYTGEAPASFIRRRRLNLAFRDLKERRHLQILEVSLRYGYESLSAFGRAFRRRFGFTPQESARFHGGSLGLWKTQQSESAKQTWRDERIEDLLGYQVIGVNELGYEGRSFAKTAKRAFGKAISSLENLQLSIGHAVAIMDQDPDLEDGRLVHYFAGFILQDAAIPELIYPLQLKSVEPGRFAVFTHRGSYLTLWQTWNLAYRNWLPHSSYELRDALPFEVYLKDPRHVQRDSELVTEIYLPIKER